MGKLTVPTCAFLSVSCTRERMNFRGRYALNVPPLLADALQHVAQREAKGRHAVFSAS